MDEVGQSPLGKAISYVSQYQASLLFPIARNINRAKLAMHEKLPFKGQDSWNAFELSWLNKKGKPVVAIGEFIFPCESPNLIESKSFKLYLNSFNNTRFESMDDVIAVLKFDLSAAAGAAVDVKVITLDHYPGKITKQFSGICLDQSDIECDTYSVEPAFLKTESAKITEILYSDLLKSNCLVTGQPDWASIQIHYTGQKINHEGLLKYLISYRNHNDFHEQCVERIFMEILKYCQPEKLTIHARYTRRGGLDINPFRSTENISTIEPMRLCRQ